MLPQVQASAWSLPLYGAQVHDDPCNGHPPGINGIWSCLYQDEPGIYCPISRHCLGIGPGHGHCLCIWNESSLTMLVEHQSHPAVAEVHRALSRIVPCCAVCVFLGLLLAAIAWSTTIGRIHVVTEKPQIICRFYKFAQSWQCSRWCRLALLDAQCLKFSDCLAEPTGQYAFILPIPINPHWLQRIWC